MNAGTKGTILVKADRINERVDKVADVVLNGSANITGVEVISTEMFRDFVKSVHQIVDTELNEKGVERQWKA